MTKAKKKNYINTLKKQNHSDKLTKLPTKYYIQVILREYGYLLNVKYSANTNIVFVVLLAVNYKLKIVSSAWYQYFNYLFETLV